MYNPIYNQLYLVNGHNCFLLFFRLHSCELSFLSVLQNQLMKPAGNPGDETGKPVTLSHKIASEFSHVFMCIYDMIYVCLIIFVYVYMQCVYIYIHAEDNYYYCLLFGNLALSKAGAFEGLLVTVDPKSFDECVLRKGLNVPKTFNEMFLFNSCVMGYEVS